jgi:selenocysteine lyase/cysteine desulfurase
LRAAADYLGVQPGDVALTDSTTMGLGLLYGGLVLRDGQEILTTEHDYYSTTEALRLRAERTGARVRTIPLYRDLATVSAGEIVETLRREVRPETRVVAVTWIHSSTGLKLPIRAMAGALAELNAGRAEEDRALLCVDAVHGLGVEAVGPADLGCDFFVAGCHKWLFGPRGTGVVWGSPAAWPSAIATIPSFDISAYGGWSPAAAMSPGGFHSFEHRWALDQAFSFHLAIGKAAIEERIHALNRRLKEGLAELDRVLLRTPLADDLAAGIVCFEIDGLPSEAAVAWLRERRIVASVAPYATRYARLAPGLLTSPAEVDETLAAVRELAGG